MAKKHHASGRADEPSPDGAATQSTESTEPEADGMIAFDKEASNAAISACAGIASLASTAVEDATGAASPFLSFAQRTRIRALATNFDAHTGAAVVVHAPAPRQVEAKVVPGDGLTRDEVDAIVAHRVQIAVTEALKALGLSPDATLEDQIDRKVEAHIGSQEHRLLEYVKRHLTDSLEMLETSLDERIAEFVESAEGSAATAKEERREVEAQLEEARENLLKNIDEVRTVDVGFDIGDFAASIVEVDRVTGAHDAGALEAALDGNAEEGAFEMAADDDVGGDEDQAAEETEEEAEAADEGADDAVQGEDVDVMAEGAEALAVDADADAIDADDGGLDEDAVVLDDDAIALDDDAVVLDDAVVADEDALAVTQASDIEDAGEEIEVEVAPAAGALYAQVDLDDLDVDDLVQLDVGALDVSPVEMSVAFGVEDQIEVEVGADPDDGSSPGTDTLEAEGSTLDLDELDSHEDLEEISVIQPMPDAGGDAEVIDLDVDVGDDEDLSLMTLGEGPDEIQVGVLDAPFSENEFDIDVDVDDEIEIEVEDGRPGEESNGTIIRKYIDKAVQMSARQQHTAALELYSKVLDIDADHFDALVSRGMIYARTKDYRKATEDFRRAQNAAPDRAGSHFGLAELHYNRRQFNKAIKNYNLALERDDMLAEAYCRRGLSYYYLKNYKNAFHDLYRAYDIDPELPKIRSFLKLVQNKIKEGEG